LLGGYHVFFDRWSEWVYLNGELLAQFDKNPGWANPPYYFHNDHLGTPQRMTDATANLKWDVDYKPFGEVAFNVLQMAQPFRFPGQYKDQLFNIHYNYQRYYDPSLGRYITSDPIGLAGGLNTYGYVGGDPINLVDPAGLGPPQDSFTRTVLEAIRQGNVDFLKDLARVAPKELRPTIDRAVKELTTSADDFISQSCKGSVRREFPSQYLDKTLEEIRQAAKSGDAIARKADKLLREGRFRK
jgi:RHS repeat-associated protein